MNPEEIMKKEIEKYKKNKIPREITRKDIIKESQNNKLLYDCISFWRSGECTYEEALQLYIVKEEQ